MNFLPNAGMELRAWSQSRSWHRRCLCSCLCTTTAHTKVSTLTATTAHTHTHSNILALLICRLQNILGYALLVALLAKTAVSASHLHLDCARQSPSPSCRPSADPSSDICNLWLLPDNLCALCLVRWVPQSSRTQFMLRTSINIITGRKLLRCRLGKLAGECREPQFFCLLRNLLIV